jgi:hypothetical protein
MNDIFPGNYLPFIEAKSSINQEYQRYLADLEDGITSVCESRKTIIFNMLAYYSIEIMVDDSESFPAWENVTDDTKVDIADIFPRNPLFAMLIKNNKYDHVILAKLLTSGYRTYFAQIIKSDLVDPETLRLVFGSLCGSEFEDAGLWYAKTLFVDFPNHQIIFLSCIFNYGNNNFIQDNIIFWNKCMDMINSPITEHRNVLSDLAGTLAKKGYIELWYRLIRKKRYNDMDDIPFDSDSAFIKWAYDKKFIIFDHDIIGYFTVSETKTRELLQIFNFSLSEIHDLGNWMLEKYPGMMILIDEIYNINRLQRLLMYLSTVKYKTVDDLHILNLLSIDVADDNYFLLRRPKIIGEIMLKEYTRTQQVKLCYNSQTDSSWLVSSYPLIIPDFFGYRILGRFVYTRDYVLNQPHSHFVRLSDGINITYPLFDKDEQTFAENMTTEKYLVESCDYDIMEECTLPLCIMDALNDTQIKKAVN